MTRVLTAIDATEGMHLVLAAADIAAAVYEGEVDVVHVTADPSGAAELAERAGRPVRCLAGDVGPVIIGEVAADDVMIAVMGVREGTGTTRAGHIAVDVATHVEKPLVLVPPTWTPLQPDHHLRLLIPLDGTEESSITVRALVNRVARTGAELVILHVFDEASVPRFLDHPEHDLPEWAHEFLSRHCDQPDSRLQWRSGPVGAGIAETAASEEVDAVVLGWARVLRPGHAAAVQEVLSRVHVPVVLVPRVASERALAAARA